MKQKRPFMRAAINAKCKDCIYDELAPGNWRQQVQECTGTDCPLWPLRPISKPHPERRSKTAAIPADPDLPATPPQGQGCEGGNGGETGPE